MPPLPTTPSDRLPDVAREDVVALIAAAGSGTRLGLGPKAFLALGDSTLLERVAGLAMRLAAEVHVAVTSDRIATARGLLDASVHVHAGGDSRTATFERLFAASRASFVLLLDVARPFVSARLARAVLAAAAQHGAAGAYVRSPVPAALPGEGPVDAAIAASRYRLPQMPQAFQRESLTRVFGHGCAHTTVTQTVWELAVNAGISVHAVNGEETNIKITTPLDWAFASHVIHPLLEASAQDRDP